LASMWKSAAATSGDSKRTSAQVSKKSTESKKELSAKDKALIIREKEKLEAARYLFGPENENDDEKTHRANMKKFHSILAQERKERLQGGKEATSMDDFASLFDDLAIRSSDEYESFPRLFAKAGAMFEKYGWEADNAYVMDAAESMVLEDFKPSDSDELRFPFDKISKIGLGYPIKIPETDNKSIFVNFLLEQSLNVQSSVLTDTELDQCLMSGDSLTVCGILHLHLKQIGVPSEFHTGILKIDNPELPIHNFRLPMVWLTIRGKLIDNTYRFLSPESLPYPCKPQILKNKVSAYLEEDPTTVNMVDEIDSSTCVASPELLKTFATPENIEKYLLFRAWHKGAFPHLLAFLHGWDLVWDSCRITNGWSKSVQRVAKSCVAAIKPVANRRKMIESMGMCWNCGQKSESVKKCIDCKLAHYCNAECQSADWPEHKLLHQDKKANVKYHRDLQCKRENAANNN